MDDLLSANEMCAISFGAIRASAAAGIKGEASRGNFFVEVALEEGALSMTQDVIELIRDLRAKGYRVASRKGLAHNRPLLILTIDWSIL